MSKPVFVYVSSIERVAEVTLFDTEEQAVRHALADACDQYDNDASLFPDELVDALAAHGTGDIDEAIEHLDDHYENNGVDDEFVTIARAPLPGHTSGEDKGDEEQQAAQ